MVFLMLIFTNPVIANEPEITPATAKKSEPTPVTKESAADPVAAKEPEEICEALFVHSAKGFELKGSTLTMKGFNPTVIFFCDRPVRMAGNLSVQEFLDSVSKGPDSFKDNPPNAVLSVLSGEEIVDIVVTLTKKPQIVGDDMVFKDIQIIEGEPVQSGSMSTLFIDPIGRPMSPTSIAGRHRRHRRRVIRRH